MHEENCLVLPASHSLTTDSSCSSRSSSRPLGSVAPSFDSDSKYCRRHAAPRPAPPSLAQPSRIQPPRFLPSEQGLVWLNWWPKMPAQQINTIKCCNGGAQGDPGRLPFREAAPTPRLGRLVLVQIGIGRLITVFDFNRADRSRSRLPRCPVTIALAEIEAYHNT